MVDEVWPASQYQGDNAFGVDAGALRADDVRLPLKSTTARNR